MTSLVDRLRAQARTKATLETRNRQYFSTITKPVSCGPDEFCEWQAADRIEELEQQLATMTEKAIVGEYMWTPVQLHEAITAARREALEEAAAYHDDLAAQHDAVAYESDHHERMVKEHRRFAAAIRSLSDSSPTPLQEQNANGGKEGE